LVILAQNKLEMTTQTGWIHSFGAFSSIKREEWGVLTSFRVNFISGAEIEFGIADPTWALSSPVDEGTRRVVTDAAKILWDPHQMLAKLLAVATQE
jgi:hypothetical protein